MKSPPTVPAKPAFDLMRYVPGSHWGAMDYLFAQMMLIQKNEGFRTFNFAVAPFVGIGDRPNATLTEKAVNQIFERLDWFLHSKGIKQYKLKFEPQWRDVFVAISGWAYRFTAVGIERQPYSMTVTVRVPTSRPYCFATF